MVKERAWPVRAMYLLIAAALVISMIIVAAPAHKVSAAPADEVAAEWERVATPTMGGFVLAPNSYIIDYALADGGDVAYAVVMAYNETCEWYATFYSCGYELSPVEVHQWRCHLDGHHRWH